MTATATYTDDLTLPGQFRHQMDGLDGVAGGEVRFSVC